MRSAWEYVGRQAAGSIACVQEAQAPNAVDHVPYTLYYKGCGTTIASYGPAMVPDTSIKVAPGRGAFARVTTATGREVRLASLHGAKGKIRGFEGDQIAAYVVLDWLRNELQPLLQDGERGSDIVIAGDLNSSTQWSIPSAHGKVQSELLSHGFANALAGAARYGPEHGPCPCKSTACEHAPSYRRMSKGSATWWSIDYVWISASLRQRLAGAAFDYEQCPTLSDHALAYADLDI